MRGVCHRSDTKTLLIWLGFAFSAHESAPSTAAFADQILILNMVDGDCGFTPGGSAVVDLDGVFVKLQNQVEAARVLRTRFGGG